MLDPGEFFTSLASIATLEAISVANIDSPTELNSAVGAVVGERRVCYQAVANDNVYTVYYFDSADGSGASSPYVLAASGSGFWIAGGGKYTNSAILVRSTISGTQLISTIATGTAPLSIASTTVVPNLNVSQLLGATWASPGTIGSGTPSTGAFTTISASGVITSTLATGTAPFTVASTTVVGNLNVSQLLGSTWASPASIGSGTPASGAFTTLTTSGKAAVAASGVSSFGILVVGEGGTNPLSGTTQQGVRSVITSTTAATSGTHGVLGAASTFAGSYTCGFATGGYFQFGTLGAGSAVTRASGILAERSTSGTNKAGLCIIDAGSSPAWIGTFAIASESTQPSLFAGALSVTDSTASTTTATGCVTLTGGLGVAGNITFSGATGASLRLVTATANASIATTLGSVGPTGSTAGNPQGWLRISVAGTDRFIPFW